MLFSPLKKMILLRLVRILYFAEGVGGRMGANICAGHTPTARVPTPMKGRIETVSPRAFVAASVWNGILRAAENNLRCMLLGLPSASIKLPAWSYSLVSRPRKISDKPRSCLTNTPRKVLGEEAVNLIRGGSKGGLNTREKRR